MGGLWASGGPPRIVWVVGEKYMVLYAEIWPHRGQEPNMRTGDVEDIFVYV